MTKRILLHTVVLIDFSLSVKAATLIFISGRGSAISSPKEGKSAFIYNLVKELISVSGRGNVRAFHENPNVYTLNSHLITLKAHNHKTYVFAIH